MMKTKGNHKGFVLTMAAVLSAMILSACSTPGGANNGTNRANTPRAQATAPTNAPPGATPPNQSGSSTATVTLEEFADFQCGSCAVVHPVFNEIKSLYGSRIRFIYRNFPLQMHDKAYDAAVAAEAAGLQGKFWDMQNLLFTNQRNWSASPGFKATFKEYAEKIGLDVAKWETDLAGLQAKTRVDADMARGKALNVNSTPSLYVNNVPVQIAEMTVPVLKTIIDAELAKAAPQAAQSTASNTNAGTANTGNTNK